MKVCIKRTTALVLALLLTLLCLAGCGGKGGSGSESFTVSIKEPFNVDEEAMQMTYDRWEKLTDAEIKWDLLSSSDTAEAVKLRFATGDYPEVLLGNHLQSTEISKYAASGALVALDEYINEEDTPNLYKLFQERPKTAAANYLPDGHMYSLPMLNEFAAGFLEQTIFINKNWLDKLGLEVPTTLDELKDVLRAFKTQDPNGNGKQDEIPLSFNTKCGYAYPEALLSCWGVSTKNGTFDSYCTVQDGEVKFAPLMDEWKELIEFYRDLYSEGLLDVEAFTHTTETFYSKLQSTTSVVGCVWYNTNVMANADEYIAIAPLRAKEGVDPVWRIHPGVIGSRDMFVITTACKNPKTVMQWIDKFYSFDESVQNQNGNVGKTMSIDENGKYVWNDPPEGTTFATFLNNNLIATGIPSAILAEDIDTRVELAPNKREKLEAYKLYEDYLDDEPWPRPYYTEEESSRYAELTTDIFNYIDETKAKWVVGKSDINADWEGYKKHIYELGIEEMLKINQTAYDRYVENMK